MTDWLFSLPIWLVIVLVAIPVVVPGAIIALALAAAAAYGDETFDQALRGPTLRGPAFCDRIDRIGDEADTVTWLYPRPTDPPKLTLIRGGGDAA